MTVPREGNKLDEVPDKYTGLFMFIYASNGGVNAKPDKLVRSFVMKSARHKNRWSTHSKRIDSDGWSASKKSSHHTSRRNKIAQSAGLARSLSNAKSNEFSKSAHRSSAPAPRLLEQADIQLEQQGSYSPCNSDLCLPKSTSSLIHHQTSEPTSISLRSAVTSKKSSITRNMGSSNSLIVPLDLYEEGLLQFFIDVAAPRLIPVDVHQSSAQAAKEWLIANIQSPDGASFIHAALVFSSRANGINANRHKRHAIAEINRLLPNPSRGTSNVTIAAVLILLAIEEAELACPFMQAEDRTHSIMINDAHTNGLRAMVRQRGGGLDNLNFSNPQLLHENTKLDNDMNRNLSKIADLCEIDRHSIAQAITTFKTPYISLSDTSVQLDEYALPTQRLRLCYELTPHLPRFAAQIADRKLVHIIAMTAGVVDRLVAWYSASTLAHGALKLQREVNLSMYELFDWYHQHSKPGRDNSIASTVDRSVSLAALIFTVHAVETDIKFPDSRLLKAVFELHNMLQSTSPAEWGTSELFVWVITMAMLGANNLPGSRTTTFAIQFFIQYTKRVFHERSWGPSMCMQELLEQMDSCLWIHSIFDERAVKVWVTLGLCNTDVLEKGYEDGIYGSEQEQEDMEDYKYALGKSTKMRFFTAK